MYNQRVSEDQGARDLRTHVDELRRRVAALEARVGATSGPDTTGAPSDTPARKPSDTPARKPGDTPGEGDPALWVLNELGERYDRDVVVYAGTADVATGPVRWQYGVAASELLETDFALAAPALEAVAHPVRLTLLKAILGGTTSSAQLSELDGMGTSGQVYHHLGQLSSAGWIRSVRRGQWEVPAARVIPLLTLVLAATT